MGGVIQLVVPAAVPESPAELDQVTSLTPTLSLAVPLTTMELAEVETVLLGGETIANDGGVVSGAAGGGFAGGLDCWRVTVKRCSTLFPPLSRAVMVIIFKPRLKGIAAMIQLGAPWTTPENP
jgi:hypothetical protein